jgi:hypothetical protein
LPDQNPLSFFGHNPKVQNTNQNGSQSLVKVHKNEAGLLLKSS